MNLDKIKPINKWVFLEVIEEEVTPGGIIIPIQYRERFPQTGIVLAWGPRCNERFAVGEVALLVNEGIRTDNSYWAVCSLSFTEDPIIEHCDVEVWPAIKEAVEVYRANPTSANCWIHVKTIDQDSLSFLASDVRDYEITDLSNSGLRLDYVNAVIVEFEKAGITRRFYFVKESDILATLETP